jgi:hypothetical protein
LISFFMMMLNGGRSFDSWASMIGYLIRDTISKQAVWKKMREKMVNFLERVLAEAIKIEVRIEKWGGIFERFERVWIEDGTHIRVNDELCKYFPGSANQEGKKAILKIDAIYNAKCRNFKKFEITNFRNNDQNLAWKILEIAEKGDLTIRDLGYFVLRWFKEANEKGIYYLSRWKYGVKVYERYGENEFKEIDLLEELKKGNILDIDVYIGEEGVPVRLVAVPVTEEVANKRRRKAKANRNQNINHSKKYLKLLGWEIFITNVEREIWTTEQVAQAYGVRWRIEIIFKCWKSHFKITEIPERPNIIRIKAYIYCMLIFIVIFQTHLFNYFSTITFLSTGKHLSILKFSRFIKENAMMMLLGFTDPEIFELLKKQIIYHCVYEKRRKRLNYAQKFPLLS